MEESAETPKVKVPTLTALSASMTFENLPEEKKAEAFLHWISTQSDEVKLGFLENVEMIVTKGIRINSNFVHYVIIGSLLTKTFANQEYIDILNLRLDDLIGEDQATVAFVDYGERALTAHITEINEVKAALAHKNPIFNQGICFKLDGKFLSNTEHTPIYFNYLDDLFDAIIETIYHLTPDEDRTAALAMFMPLREADRRISFDFEIILPNQQTRKIIYFAPKP